jgi:hypothetical protein
MKNMIEKKIREPQTYPFFYPPDATSILDTSRLTLVVDDPSLE